MAADKKRGFPLLLGFVMLLAGCGEMRPPGETSRLASYTVRPGDTLYSIAWRYGYDYREIAAWNGIKAPYQIHPGLELVIIPRAQFIPAAPTQAQPSTPSNVGRTDSAVVAAPAVIPPAPRPIASRGSWKEKTKTARSGQEKNTPPNNHATTRVPYNAASSASATTKVKAAQAPRVTDGSVAWRWPTKGRLVSTFGNSGAKGVDIAGQTGQAVFAAATGNVVYSGNGLIGYGNLIIIKHNDTYLSAYAHNSRLLVKEGDRVTTGQKIAEMGRTAKSGSILHFEVRQNGKPVDPLRFLPKQTL